MNEKLPRNHEETLIIGAGPAGMAAAMELCASGRDFAVVEKSDRVGGLSKTYVIKEDNLEFRTDNGPHRFFSKNQYLYDFIEGLIQERWIVVKRSTRQFINGKYFDYPINALQVVKNVGVPKVAHMAIDYAIAAARYRVFGKRVNNFHDYAVANFGRALARFNILGYTEKIWGVPTQELHADWARQRIKGLSFRAILKDTFSKMVGGKNANVPKTLVDVFYYPEMGTGLIYDTIREKIEAAGRCVFTETVPVSVRHQAGRITSVRLQRKGVETDVAVDNLVESVPIGEFLTLLNPLPPPEVLAAARALRYRSQVYLFITPDKAKISDDQWIYFPDPQVPFARVSEMRNFSSRMAPPGKTSLFVEFFCDENDSVYCMSADELFELALPHFAHDGFFARSEVRKYYKFSGGKDYPIYDLHYETHLKKIKAYLDQFENLFYIGRPGRFKYTNQDHSLEMGMLAAQSIIEDRRYDIESVGAEKEYLEKGSVWRSKSV